jgi:tryptophan synthase alpha chain
VNQRIATTFSNLRKEKRAALIPFIMGCDPDAATTAALLEALPKAGADLIEIGMAFSDPMADGPVIQAAGLRALSAGASVKGVLKLVKAFRKHNDTTPIILMGYYNPIYRYGKNFCRDAAEAGADGLILVDLPPEEDKELRPQLEASGLKLIRLVAPTSDDTRLKMLTASASGFVYYISITGITGAKAADTDVAKRKVDHLHLYTSLPIAVGFGIKTSKQAKQVAEFADAVVVGSALVDIIAKQTDKTAAVKAATDFVSDLAKVLKK